MRQDTGLERRRGQGWKVALWLSGVFGGVATFLGFFILFGGDDKSVGIGGDLSWEVGDISSAWTYGLLIGGLALLAMALAMVVTGRRMGPVETTPFEDLLFHAGVFLVVNAYIWVQDFALGDGLDYGYLVTIPWAVGLAIHAWSYFRQRREPEPVPKALDTAPEAIEPSEAKELQRH